MASRLLLSSLLLMLVWNVNSTPANQESSSNNLLEIRDSKTGVTEYTASNATMTRNRIFMPCLKIGKKKYYLETIFKVNWYKAMQYCLYHDMRLASVESKEENDQLVKFIVDSGYRKESFWTSGTDLAEEGKFFWAANGRRFTFTNWHSDQPNNKNTKGENENCMEMVDYGNGIKWNDENCFSRIIYFICEAPSDSFSFCDF